MFHHCILFQFQLCECNNVHNYKCYVPLFNIIFHLSWPESFSTVTATKNTACTLPEKPVNGYLLPVYGAKEELVLVKYQCHPPFRLIGTQQRTCLPDGTWNGTAPSCAKGFPSPVCLVIFFYSVCTVLLLWVNGGIFLSFVFTGYRPNKPGPVCSSTQIAPRIL